MQKYIWTEKYSVGVAEIDKQHEHYFDIASGLVKLTGEESVPREKLMDKINELCDYARYHFSTEEKIFGQYAYPDAEPHIGAHEAYWEKMDQFLLQAKTAGGDTKKTAFEIAEFAGSWLVNHIMEMDQKYAAFLHSQGLK